MQFGLIAITSLLSNSVVLANNLQSVTSVYQLKETQTINWESRTLQSLAQRHNCSNKFQSRDDRYPLNRNEFASLLAKCLAKIPTINNSQDIIILQRLQQNLIAELARSRNRIDKIESETKYLENNQFSTTTKFEGEVLFLIADSFESESDKSQLFSGYRTRLDFNTSFYGKDVLKIRLESKNIGRLDDVTDTSLSRIGVDGSTDNNIELSELSYTFAPTKTTQITLGTLGVGLNDIGEVLNPFSSSGKGAISRFGRRNPATLRGSGGSGIGIKQQIGETISANAGYLINNETVGDPESGGGLFASSASAIAQIVFEPSENLAFAFTYTHIYQQTDDVNLMGSTGIADSNQPFGDNATTADNLGLQFNWVISSRFEIGGWFGYTNARQQATGSDRATILNGAITLAFPDLWRENNLGGIIFGVPPAISSHDDSSLIVDRIPFHIETLYRIKINQQISLTPGIFAVINPDTEDSNTIWVGVMRTQFSF